MAGKAINMTALRLVVAIHQVKTVLVPEYQWIPIEKEATKRQLPVPGTTFLKTRGKQLIGSSIRRSKVRNRLLGNISHFYHSFLNTFNS